MESINTSLHSLRSIDMYSGEHLGTFGCRKNKKAFSEKTSDWDPNWYPYWDPLGKARVLPRLDPKQCSATAVIARQKHTAFIQASLEDTNNHTDRVS